MASKLTKAERLVNERMLAVVEWAAKHPKHWHNIGKLEATRKAAELLAKRSAIEIWKETNLYRLKPKLTGD
jgi:NDP-sugar pyrophosphorylase family protein